MDFMIVSVNERRIERCHEMAAARHAKAVLARCDKSSDLSHLSRHVPEEHKAALGLSSELYSLFYGAGQLPLTTRSQLAYQAGQKQENMSRQITEVAEAILRARDEKYEALLNSAEQSCDPDATSAELAQTREALVYFRHRAYDGTRQNMSVPEKDESGRDDINYVGPVTILAAICGWAFVMKSTNGGQTTHLEFRGDSFSSLQCQAEKPAEYLIAGLERVQPRKPSGGVFKRFVDAAVIDEDAPNLRAERFLKSDLVLLCDAHKIATAMSRTSKGTDHVATGMINCAVSLKGSEWASF